MDFRRLELLLALSRLGSMRAVADTHNLTTSTVSQQLAALARDTGAQLIEPDGRRVRLTPAGRRLAEHAVSILAGVDAALHDLDPGAEPRGTVRVGGFATGIRVSLLPVLTAIAESHPGIDVIISEFEPVEAFRLLTDDHLDVISGKRDTLVGKVQETYGITRDEAELQIKRFEELNKDSTQGGA